MLGRAAHPCMPGTHRSAPSSARCAHFLVGSTKASHRRPFFRVELRLTGLAAGDTGVTSLWLTPDDGREEQDAEVGFPDSAGKCPPLSWPSSRRPAFPASQKALLCPVLQCQCGSPSPRAGMRQQDISFYRGAGDLQLPLGSWRARTGVKLLIPGSFHASLL